jgi:N-acetylglucosaminyldiphosphoundecaprenol N-acetyl-beta-D-mannosaminyltransferase
MAERASFLGVPIDLLSMEETVARCAAWIEQGRAVQHVVVNAGKMVQIADDPTLREIVAACPLVSVDGQGVVLGARFLGIPVPERVAGIDLMERLIALAARRGWPVFFLGATEEVNASFARIAVERFPGLSVAGRHHGYFAGREDEVVRAIAASGARLLFVAMSSPAKEVFLARHLSALGPVFAMGVGGSFDVWAGKTRRAPGWMQRAGLEWLHRFLQEPRRMWRRYLVGNARFAALVLRARMAGRP